MPLFEFPPLETPPGALDRVVRRGRRRRLAESIATVSAVVVILAGGAFTLISGANNASGPAKIVPANSPAPHGVQAAPSSRVGGQASPAQAGTGTANTAVGPSQPQSSRQLGNGAEPQSPSPAPLTAVSSVDPSACSSYVGPPSIGWCQLVAISAHPRAGSASTVTTKVCRMTDAGTGTLRIDPGQPIRFDVSASSDNPTNPVWSARHSSDEDTLLTQPGQCWSWSRSWNVVDSHGHPLQSCSVQWNLYGRVVSPDLERSPYGRTQFTANPPSGSGQPDCQPLTGSPL